MKIKDRKKALLLVSNAGFLDSLQESWSSSDIKKTINEVFGDSKKEQQLPPGLKNKAKEVKENKDSKSKSSVEEMAKNLVKEIKDFFHFKDNEEKLYTAEKNPQNKNPAKVLEGYRRATSPLPSSANEEAKKLLPLPMGSMKSVKLNNGKWYIAVVEEHFDNHPKGGGEPYKHKGVSLYEPVIGSGEFRV